MALTLQDFNKGPDVKEMRMEAFQPRMQPSPAANSATINTLATYGAALSPDGNVDSAYQSITNQLSYGSSSVTLDTIIGTWDKDNTQASMDTLRSIILDPDLPDEQKQLVMDNYQTHTADNSLYRRVGMSAAIAPSEGENGEQESIRINFAQGLNEVDEFHSWTQQNMNALLSENNAGFNNGVKSLVESFLPFADAADQAFFENSLGLDETGGISNTAQTLLLLGEGKERLRATLAKMPLEARRDVVNKLMTTIKSTQGSVGGDGLALKQMQALEQMITPGGYGNVDRWADNIFSVMDDTILLSPFAKGARGLGNAMRAAKGTRLESEIFRRGEAAAAASSEEVKLLEFKPAPVSYADDLDAIVESLDPEILNRGARTSGTQIQELRTAVNEELGKGDGFSIDNVIDRLSMADAMTADQIIDLRAKLGGIQIKRKNDLEGNLPEPKTDFSEVQRVYINSNVQSTSISQIYKDANPSKARIAHNAVLADDTGRAAEVLYGTSRSDALANDYLPEIGGNGRVRSKMEFDGDATPDIEILRKHKEARGDIQYKTGEKKAVRAKVAEEWRNAVGLKARSAMSSIEDVSSGVKLGVVYGPKDGGFVDAFKGIEGVKLALRKYGIRDNELTILTRQKDGRYAPASSKQDFRNGDFLVRVDHNYEFSPMDFEYKPYDNSPIFKFTDVKLPGERSGGQGGLTQHIIPKSAVIDQRVFASGVSAADKSAGTQKQLLNHGNNIAKLWKKLGPEQQQLVDQYIRRANDEGWVFNTAKIKAAGMNDDAVNLLVEWKTAQDTLWTLENMDVNKTLRNRGFEYFEHKASNTKLLAKPIPRGSVVYGKKYYTTDDGGTVKVLSQKEIDELYEKGGTVGELRRPEDFDGEVVEYVAIKQSPDGGYSRRIRDEDITLNYRHGYYHVRYTDPFYITKTSKDGSTTTIARAGSMTDARAEADRLNATQDGSTYDFKHDRNSTVSEQFDDELSVAFSSGRSSQKLRGKRLRKVGEDKTVSDMSMESPIESLTRSIGSVAHRVNFRDVVEADKRRWMQQFKHLAKRQNGIPTYPKSLDDIRSGGKVGEDSNARHTWRYIQGLENGYTNMIDDGSKMFFNWVGDTSANAKGFGWVEKIARKASQVSPAATARMTAFRLFLASNPHGQLLLQVAPAFPVIASTNPLAFGKVFRQYGVLAAFNRGVDVSTTIKVGKVAGLSTDEMKEIVKDYELSGMSAAVNAHSYLADDLARLADKNMAQKSASVALKPLRFTQKIGFDFGEQSLIDLIWLSERDRMTKGLKRTTLTGEERELLSARVRALTGDMNRGGDMPYNQNSFSTGLQFFQTPHKIAASLILGHRGLSGADRAKLAAGYIVAFGVPFESLVNATVDAVSPGDQDLRDIIKGGLTNLVFNNFLSSMTGTDVNVAFSERLQPFTLEPFTDLVGGILSGTIPELLAGGAAPSLLADGGRIAEFFKAVSRPFTPNDYQNVDEFQQIGLTFLQTFTGISNTMKAMYINEHNKIVTAGGQVVDNDVSFAEAMAKAAGFQTLDEVHYWAGNQAEWAASDRIQGDIENVVDQLFTMYTRQGMDVQTLDAWTDVMAEASRIFNSNPAYMEKVADYMKFKINQDPDTFYRNVFNRAGLYNDEELLKIINNSGWNQEQVDTLMEIRRIAGEAYGG